jgi:hypothetical protein
LPLSGHIYRHFDPEDTSTHTERNVDIQHHLQETSRNKRCVSTADSHHFSATEMQILL